jgi:DNA (cytosine-5)-methyltransferase 1
MSAIEYARLQGVPEFRFDVPEQQAMYGFGDAVCMPAVKWIDENLLSKLVGSDAQPARSGRDGRVAAR